MNMSDQNIEKLATAIARAISNPDIVNIGKIRNPYKQFDFTVLDGAIETIDYSYDFWRMLELSATAGVTLRFGKTGTPTDIVGAGVGNSLPDPVGAFQIINKSGNTITGTVGLAIGEIHDDRLNVSGSLNVAVASIITPEDDITLEVSGGSPVEILPLDSTRGAVMITNTHNVHAVRLGDANVTPTKGVQLAAGATMQIACTAAIYGISTKNATVDIAIATTEG